MAGDEPCDPVLAVVDVDGVLADVRHRLHHVHDRPKDWKAFFAAASKDPLLEEGRRTVRRLAEDHTIVYLSGRPEHCRAQTLEWFARHEIPQGPVFLRPEGDRRPAREVKIEMLGKLEEIAPIGILVDDDDLVCDAARAAGYAVWHADWMGEEPTLHEAQEVDGAT